MLTPAQLQQIKSGGAKTSPTTTGYASAEEAKNAFVATSTPSEPTRNILQSTLGAFFDPILQTGAYAGEAAGATLLKGANALSHGALDKYAKNGGVDKSIDKAINTPARIPGSGTPLPGADHINAENTIGRAVSTVGLGAKGVATGGALIGAGNAMQNDAGPVDTGIQTVVSALGGKILEHGFTAVAPYVEKAVAKFGKPIIDGIAHLVPDSAKSFISDLTSKIPNITDAKILPDVVSQPINKANEALPNFIDKPIDTAIDTASAAIKDTATNMFDSITGKGTPQNIDKFITDNFSKAVRPSVGGKGTEGQLGAYNDKAIGAVKTIVENKPNLSIVDENGETANKLPTTLKEFSQSIDQTKQQIFKQYDTLAKQTGDAGAKVDLTPISAELNKVANDPVTMDTHPEISTYAKARAKTLNARGSYTPEQTQQAIQLYNKSLESFYKNPSYDTASKAAVDALIANQMRSSLDATIENTSGAGYQELKNKYGQLKTIEKDVVHRAIVDGRKNAKGLLDFADIGSAAELMRGIVTMNPADFAVSATMKAVSKYYKYLNNPNTAIERMFSGVEKASGNLHPTMPNK